jgi:hypothetical protein
MAWYRKIQRIGLACKLPYLLVWSWHARRSLEKKPLKLPPTQVTGAIDDTTVADMVRTVDALLPRLLPGRRHYCFYRSVVLALLLRKKGIPVVINVGGLGLATTSRMTAHCWLTLNGDSFFEQPNSLTLYHFDMGHNTDRSIRYWIGPDFDESLLNNGRFVKRSTLSPAASHITSKGDIDGHQCCRRL